MARSAQNDENKDDLNSALATFYEEITNATKQVYSGLFCNISDYLSYKLTNFCIF